MACPIQVMKYNAEMSLIESYVRAAWNQWQQQIHMPPALYSTAYD